MPLVADLLLAPPVLRVRASTAQTIPTGTDTTLTWGVTDKNVGGFTVAGSGVVTVPLAGEYLVTASVRFVSNATGYRRLQFLEAGTLVADIAIPAIAASQGIALATAMQLTASQTVEVRVTQTSGGNLDTAPSAKTPQLNIRMLS